MSIDFGAEKEKLEANVNNVENEIAELMRKRDKVKDMRQIVEKYSSVESLDRGMVEKLIDHVAVGKRDKVTRQVPIEIHWNF